VLIKQFLYFDYFDYFAKFLYFIYFLRIITIKIYITKFNQPKIMFVKFSQYMIK